MKKANKTKNDFVYRLVELQGNLKIYHWMTHSYSKHKVSDKLYTELVAKIDKLVESYMGIYGRPVLSPCSLKISSMDDNAFISYIKGARKFLMSELPISYDNDSDIKSILDDIVSAINKALYLLTMS